MTLLLIAFFAGILTIITPCSFTILPVLFGAGIQKENNKKRIMILALSLAISVLIFSLILKASTLLIQIPLEFWNILSGALIILVGISMVFPNIWDEIVFRLGFRSKSEELLDKSIKKDSIWSAIIAGAALGPIFGGCSPTYLIVLSTILPADFGTGFAYLLAYCAGLFFVTLLVGLLGSSVLSRLKWAANPNGNFRKILGVLLIVIGVLVLFRLEKQIEAALINTNITKEILELESRFLIPEVSTMQ